MAPTTSATTRTDAAGLVRARLLTALHTGRLGPGDRVPSVRRFAALTGVNRKTVHRAFTALAHEGILETRPGSGTFVRARRARGNGGPPLPALLDLVAVCREEADRLGVTPAALARFLHTCLDGDWSHVTVGVVECNAEQIAMIGRDLRLALGVQVKPIPLERLVQDPTKALDGFGTVVTTDCHWSEVVRLAEPHGVRVYAVALDAGFPHHLLALARRNEVVVVAIDRRFGRVFGKLLRQLAPDVERLRRFRFVDARGARAVLRSAPSGSHGYFSPLVRETTLYLPDHIRRVERDWHVEARALESLRASLALDSVFDDSP